MPIIGILETFYAYPFVKYYTIRLEMAEQREKLTETDKFYEMHGNAGHSHFNEFETIVKIIDGIGHHEKGAESFLFRFEDAAHALPSGRKEAKRLLEIEVVTDSELRLYCLRLRNEVVVLLNGGIKTKDNALECPNVKQHFRFAQAVAKRIDEMIEYGEIKIVGKEIINCTGENEITLYL
jgi:hypothetical protein